MPFKSEKQRRFLFANYPEIAERWSHLKRNGIITEIDKWEKQNIGSGSFSDAFIEDAAVLVFTYEKINKTIDASKDIIVEARKLVSNNALRFLPEIERHAISIAGNKHVIGGVVDFVYKMPLYQQYQGEIDISKTKDTIHINKVLNLFRYGLSDSEIDGIMECLITFKAIATKLGEEITFDLATRNIAEKDGQIILLDPFYCISTTDKIIKNWPLSFSDKIKWKNRYSI